MRLYRLLVMSVGILLGMFLVQPVVARPQETAGINGTLTDPSGAPISGADITAQPLSSSGKITQTKSGSDGRYSIALAPGRYNVVIQYISLAHAEEEFAVAAGEKRRWDVRLELEKMSSQVIVTAAAEPIAAGTAPGSN